MCNTHCSEPHCTISRSMFLRFVCQLIDLLVCGGSASFVFEIMKLVTLKYINYKILLSYKASFFFLFFGKTRYYSNVKCIIFLPLKFFFSYQSLLTMTF